MSRLQGESRASACLLVVGAGLVVAEYSLGLSQDWSWIPRGIFGLLVPLSAGLVLADRTGWFGLVAGNWTRSLVAMSVGVPAAFGLMGLLAQVPAMSWHYRAPWSLIAALSTASLPILQVEICFRGVLFLGLKEQLGSLVAASVSTAMYALVHADKPLAEALGSIPVGVLFCSLAHWTGSIHATVVIHLAGAVALAWWAAG